MIELSVELEQLGMSFRVIVQPLGAEFLFRDVVTDGEMRGDVAVSHGGRHLFRSSSTLTLTGRDRIAKVAGELDGGDGAAWRRATFSAVERVLNAVENLGTGVDLRTATAATAHTATVLDEFWPAAATSLVMPRSAGKSTLARAAAVSIASGKEILPGLRPMQPGPVLYVAGEDPVVEFHARNVDEICRGAGLTRSRLANPIHLFDARGRSLNRIARSLAERAQECVAVILDSKQALEGSLVEGNIRAQDSAFWNGIDQIERPTLLLGHPNRADRQSWSKADGSMAGSDVSGDRARCVWKGTYEDDEDATLISSARRYTLDCVKWSHGPTFRSVSFAIERTFAHPEGWTLRFVASDRIVIRDAVRPGRPTTVYAATADAYRGGARTPELLAKALGLDYDTARMRLTRYREQLMQEIGE
jgi:hypothetical protein